MSQTLRSLEVCPRGIRKAGELEGLKGAGMVRKRAKRNRRINPCTGKHALVRHGKRHHVWAGGDRCLLCRQTKKEVNRASTRIWKEDYTNGHRREELDR